MEKEEELKKRRVMNTSNVARVTIVRKGSKFVLDIRIAKKEGKYHVLKKVAAKRWSISRNMDADERKLKLKNEYGALAVQEEEAYEEYIECQSCNGKLFCFCWARMGNVDPTIL